MVNEDWSGYTNKVSMEIVEATYKLWIDNLRVRHGRKFKNTYSRVVPILGSALKRPKHYKDRPVAAIAQAVSASPAVDTPAEVDMKET